MTLALEVRDVRRAYGAVQALRGVTLTLEPGAITCLLGPSGCGKSTLLRLIAGLEPVDGGEILKAGALVSGPGVHVPAERRGIGLVFQDYALFPHLSGFGNAEFGLQALPPARRKQQAADALARAHIGQRGDAFPGQLSGGERQRVALARAIAPAPSVLLLDEPFSGLDGMLRAQVRDAALETLRQSGAAVLIVTHDAEEAMRMGDQLALMQAGAILQSGTPEDCYLRPTSLDAARLLGPANALPARIENGMAVTAWGAFPAGHGGDTVIARPEAFVLSEKGVQAEVLERHYAGARCDLKLRAGDSAINARVPSLNAPRVGDRIHVRLDPALCTIVNAGEV
ncbi:ABC transporter ATP-binding protein [Caulobacter sp. NIBR1757]|uniref:ABC transporter ATP-binding protein n=1 Tax=Caulobacter sp. NIBR1757 TaxID=3016000 RepID=UPI0022F14430|nr:ABC transporter ATP-binding protein [Caulobacter sp. NIBR1757]WGM39071.1 Fe(3+) ions import ATP-binding protein FbpC 2 [Caulobacter sp. NIBR1757]